MKRFEPHHYFEIWNLRPRTQNSAYHLLDVTSIVNPSHPDCLSDQTYGSSPQEEELLVIVNDFFQRSSSAFSATCGEHTKACSYPKIEKVSSEKGTNLVFALLNPAGTHGSLL